MKKVLFITYYFPPSGGSGVQRALKFVKYLPLFGWQPTVLTVDAATAAYPEFDEGLMADVPAGTEVVRTHSWDPYAAYASLMGKKKSEAVGVGFLGAEHASRKEKFARWIRANFFLPDARVGWIKYGKGAVRDLGKKNAFDAVISTGPPHSAHLIAEYAAQKMQIPWIADLRDAWPDIAYADLLPTTRWARKRDIRIRNRALRRAKCLVAVTKDLAREMSSGVGSPVSVIQNGYDPADFTDLSARRLPGFSIVHTGSMAPARNPDPLWQILSTSEARSRWPELRLVFVGNVDETILEAAGRAGLSDLIEHVAYVPHEEALAFTKGASILLLPINRVSEAAGIVTGKIYEYLASNRPVLGLGEPTGEAAAILRDSGAGTMFSYADIEGISAEIEMHYTAWLSGSPRSGASPKAALVFSREAQSQQLATMLDEMAGGLK